MVALFWFFAFLSFLLFEMLVSGGFYFMGLALGALAAMVASLLGVPPAWVWAVFFFSTTLAVLTAVPCARRWLTRIPSRPVGFDALVGQHAVVTEEVAPGTGRGMVKLNQGALWLASSEGTIPVGAWVEVTEVSGTRLQVRPLANPQTSQGVEHD